MNWNKNLALENDPAKVPFARQDGIKIAKKKKKNRDAKVVQDSLFHLKLYLYYDGRVRRFFFYNRIRTVV